MIKWPRTTLESSASFHSLSSPSQSRGQLLTSPDIAVCQVVQTAKNLTAMPIPGLILESGRSPGEGSPLHYSCLENPIDRGAWLATVHGIARSQTGLSDSHPLGTNNHWCSNLSDFGNWEALQASSWLPLQLTHKVYTTWFVWEHVLASRNSDWSQAHLVLFLPRLRIGHISREFGPLEWEMVFRNHDLCTGYVHCFWRYYLEVF